MPAQWQLLSALRINAIMQALADVRALPQALTQLARTPVVPAVDSEIMARFIGRVQIADLVADDQTAAVYQSGKFSLETTAIPNLKHGVMLTQEMLNMLNAINANAGLVANDMGIFSQYENRLVDGLLLGIRQRMEALIIAMKLDGLSYNRLGIVMSGVTWGMPADLKVTPSISWDTAATATPVSDILSLKRYGAVRYGIEYDRMIMSTAAFDYMISTTEFQNHARFILPPGLSPSILPIQDIGYMKNLATTALGLREIELYDARYWSQSDTGVLASTPYLPITKVILESTQNDNDPMITDFANGVCTESIVSSLTPTNMIGQFAGPVRGPIAYATAPDDLNPPNIRYWGVARGFPRKHLLQAHAVLTVGSFTDPIPTTDPF